MAEEGPGAIHINLEAFLEARETEVELESWSIRHKLAAITQYATVSALLPADDRAIDCYGSRGLASRRGRHQKGPKTVRDGLTRKGGVNRDRLGCN